MLEPIVINAKKTTKRFNDPIWMRLIELATKRGVKLVVVSKIAQGILGLYINFDYGRKIISLDSHIPSHKRNFIMAHEIAHAVLHSQTVYNFMEAAPLIRKEKEDEANRFAERLLRFLERDGQLKRRNVWDDCREAA